MKSNKISAVCCTFRRFWYVERVFNCFLAQDYQGEKELIIYNTDEENPYIQTPELTALGVKVFNCGVDKLTGEPYKNVGAIRRDALEHATGDYYLCYDDDDVYLPFMFRQAIDRINDTGLPFFKPEKSFFNGGGNLRLVKNTMEASVIGSMDKIKEYGFSLTTGKEGTQWYEKARDNRELNENDSFFVPCYCFDWHTNPSGGFIHRQSGDIDNPSNFDNHKAASSDICNGDLKIWDEQKIGELFNPYYNYIIEDKSIDLTLIEKYLMPNF